MVTESILKSMKGINLDVKLVCGGNKMKENDLDLARILIGTPGKLRETI